VERAEARGTGLDRFFQGACPPAFSISKSSGNSMSFLLGRVITHLPKLYNLSYLASHFYIGYLPYGKGGYLKAKHKPFIEQGIWDAAQDARRRNRTSTHTKCPVKKKINALTGVTYCWYCKGRIHTQGHYHDEPRLGCYNRQKGHGCRQKSAPTYLHMKSSYFRILRLSTSRKTTNNGYFRRNKC